MKKRSPKKPKGKNIDGYTETMIKVFRRATRKKYKEEIEKEDLMEIYKAQFNENFDEYEVGDIY